MEKSVDQQNTVTIFYDVKYAIQRMKQMMFVVMLSMKNQMIVN